MRTRLAVTVAVLLAWSGIAHGETLYWIAVGAGPSNWNDSVNWSTSSGGAGGAGVPGALSNVIFDSSGPAACTIDVDAVCSNFTASGYGSTITADAANSLTAYGPTILGDGVTGMTMDLDNGALVHSFMRGLSISNNSIFKAAAFTTRVSAVTETGCFDVDAGATFSNSQGTVQFSLNPPQLYPQLTPNGVSFYNVTTKGSTGGAQLLFNGDTTIENNLDIVDADTAELNVNGTTMTMGTSTNSGTITGNETYRFNRNDNILQAASSSFPILLQNESSIDNGLYINGLNCGLKNVDVQYDFRMKFGAYYYITLFGDCTFDGMIAGSGFRGNGFDATFDGDVTVTRITSLNPLEPFIAGSGTMTFNGDLNIGSNTYQVGSGTTIVASNVTIDVDGTNSATTGSMIISGNFLNNGTFVSGSSTVIMTNGNSSVDNNAQPFYNLTAVAGGGNTITLTAGTVSDISNLLSVVNGTCTTTDKISKNATGAGTWNPLGGGVNTIALVANAQVDAGAVLETGNEPPAGTIVTLK